MFSSIFFSIAIQIILLLTRNGVIVINKDISKISIFKKTSFAITIVSFLFFSILAYLRMGTQLKYHNFLVGFIEILIWIGFLILVVLYYYLENKKQNKLVLVFSIINYKTGLFMNILSKSCRPYQKSRLMLTYQY